MADIYNIQETEEKIRNFWEKNNVYKFDSKRNKNKEIYSIDTPPPTVSGDMHMGHAFSYSQQDFIARYRRMKGNLFYPFGTDDNGLPTERLIEKLKNIKSKDMTRDEFIKTCLKTLKEITPKFISDWKKLGISCDYDIKYSTIDNNSRKLSQRYFIELYKKGLAYKKNFPTIWCPECQTSIAQAELEDKENRSLFLTLKFSSGGKELLIATTRPELLGACVCVFVNPKDKRYENLIGKKAKVPLFDFEVPIIADKSADMEKGTGVLMVCSYGDKYDVDAVNRHKLEPKLILDKDGKLNSGEYKGLKVKEARTKILGELKDKNLVKEQKDIDHAVNVHDKCGTEIEFLTTEQWFIKILDKRNEFIKQAEKIKWYPEYMFKRYKNWVLGLEWDWSISRERHFGIPIPVWECSDCKEIIIASEKELPIDPMQLKKKCPKCKKEMEPEKKVLDTWVTSSLTPQIALSLMGKNNKNNVIKIPFSLRPQGHDIIRTWAFYTIVRSYYHGNKIPWKNIMISGFATKDGEKMSKSKGNVINPQEVLENYGADCMRYWAAGPKLGEDLDYQEKDLVTGKKLLTKLWNASNFVFMNLGDYEFKKKQKLEIFDSLFMDRLNKLIEISTKYFENYEYSNAKKDIEKFFWNDFCDNYLEVVKKRIYENKIGKESAQYTLYQTLFTIIKLFSPFVPYITEELYQKYFRENEKEISIHLTDWPIKFETGKMKSGEDKLELFFEILSKIRQEKSNNKKSMKSEIILSLEKESLSKIKDLIDDLKDVSNASKIKEGKFKIDFLD